MNVVESFVISRIKSEKVISYVTPQGKGVRVTREVYLRKNIPCRTNFCPSSECHPGFSLPQFLDNIVIVDGNYALSFWEVFESTEIQGIVVTLSSLNYVSILLSGYLFCIYFNKIVLYFLGSTTSSL